MTSRLVREELDRQNRGSLVQQWLNRPVVLVPLFLLCLGVLIWKFWPEPKISAHQYYEDGAALMESKNPTDWERGWNRHLAPLISQYPDHPYQKEVDGFRQRVEELRQQRRILDGTLFESSSSAAEACYRRGLRQCQQGDLAAAKRTWQQMLKAFAGLPAQDNWLRLAESGLKSLEAKRPAVPAQDSAIEQAIEHSRQLRRDGNSAEAEAILQALGELYKDEAKIQERLREGK